MAIITGSNSYEQMYQNELHEVVTVPGDDRPFIVKVVKTTADSLVGVNGGVYIPSGSIALSDDGFVSEANSFDGTLAANAVFSGTFENVVPYGGIRISVHTTVQSAASGLQMWCSKDGTDGFAEDTYTIRANVPKTYAVPISAPYFKVIFQNGNAQANVKICVIYQRNVSIPSSHRIGDNVESDDDAQLVQAVLKAQRPGGDYTNIDATSGGNLKVALEEIDPGALPIPVTISTGSAGTINTSFADSLYLSEFSELRTANPGNRSDTEFLYDTQPLLYDSITVSGSVTFQTGTRDVLLDTIGYSGTYSSTFRKHFWIPYTPGSGQEIDITGVINYANIAGQASVFLRSSVSGSASYQYIPQSQWSAATSGVNWQNSQIFRLSFQSLKVGRIQYAMVRNGVPVKVAEINNDNIRQMGYWQYATLPPYWNIHHVSSGTITEIGYGDDENGIGFSYFSAPAPTQKIKAICETVKSQGGQVITDIPGFPGEVDNYLTPKTISNSLIPIISIRVASLFRGVTNRSLIVPLSFSLETDNPIYYQIVYRSTLTGASWGAVNSVYSGVEYDTSASAISNAQLIVEGDRLTSGLKNQQVVGGGILGRILMSLGSTGQADTLTILAVRTTTSNASVFASIKWKEIR